MKAVSPRRRMLALLLLAGACGEGTPPASPAAAPVAADAAEEAPAAEVSPPLDAPMTMAVDAPEDLVPDAPDAPGDLLLADAADVAPDGADAGGDAGRCLALQPSTKLYEYWCPGAVFSKRLCFLERQVPL